MHEAKVDIVTVPNLSEHLSSTETTQQLSARFAYAAAMKSINNLLLLGDGETWSRQSVDFDGLPEMVRIFLQVAAGAADIPVTRLLGQSPAGLSATGDSDTRNDARHDRGAPGARPPPATRAPRPDDRRGSIPPA
jgi:phage-related protein (TIGR01555 family)